MWASLRASNAGVRDSFFARGARHTRSGRCLSARGRWGAGFARDDLWCPQYAAMDVATLVINDFGARRDYATGVVQRLIEITEVTAHAQVARNGTVVVRLTGLPLTSHRLRTAVLALRIGREGLFIGRDDGVRAHS